MCMYILVKPMKLLDVSFLFLWVFYFSSLKRSTCQRIKVIGHLFLSSPPLKLSFSLPPAIMIYVDGVLFPDENSSSSLSSSSQGSSLLLDVMTHPVIISASDSFKNLEEQRVTESCSTKDRYVYIFQREYAVVNPALVDFVGMDEATTCVGLVIRNRRSGVTSIAHMDSPKVVDLGICQMLSLVMEDDSDAAELDVHMVGGYEDVDLKKIANGSGDYAKPEGYSFPLCCKLVETLQKRRENFHIQTLFILGHNTKLDAQGNTCPIFNGFLVNTSSGDIVPASFNRSSRCPDELVRRIRVSASFDDPSWRGKLLDTYDTKTDRFIIAPCSWTMRLVEYVWELNQLPDEEILVNCSTSPSAEGPDFIDNERRIWKYLLKYPEWSKTFPKRQPQISPWLNELETAHERIEDRLRQLEAIVSRIRKRAATVTTTAAPSPIPALIPPRDSTAGVIHEHSRERLVENDKTLLFSSPAYIKECPVCDGEVTDTEVIPIYGNGDDDTDGGGKVKREDCGGLQVLAEGHEFGLTNIVTTGGGGGGNSNRVVQNQDNRLRLLSSFPGLVVDSSEMMLPPPSDAASAFDVDSFVDTTTTPSLRTNHRRRSSRIAEIGPSPAVRASSLLRRNQSNTAAGSSSSSPRDFAVPGGFGFYDSSTEVVVTSASSSSRRRTEDVNSGPRTRSRRRLS
ncbi:unnamed protein product [Brassica oleracea]